MDIIIPRERGEKAGMMKRKLLKMALKYKVCSKNVTFFEKYFWYGLQNYLKPPSLHGSFQFWEEEEVPGNQNSANMVARELLRCCF